jgi:transposase-like protein
MPQGIRYTVEFKQKAVDAAARRTGAMAAVADEFGVSTTALNRWVREAKTRDMPEPDALETLDAFRDGARIAAYLKENEEQPSLLLSDRVRALEDENRQLRNFVQTLKEALDTALPQ